MAFEHSIGLAHSYNSGDIEGSSLFFPRLVSSSGSNIICISYKWHIISFYSFHEEKTFSFFISACQDFVHKQLVVPWINIFEHKKVMKNSVMARKSSSLKELSPETHENLQRGSGEFNFLKKY